MADNVSLSTFPDNSLEALTMLYIQNQDLSGKTPEDLVDLYDETYDKIRNRKKENREKKKSNKSIFI